VFHINLPPLRDHKDDISLLVRLYFCATSMPSTENTCAGSGGSSGYFHGAHVAGNIRELRNILERAAIMCEKDLITRAAAGEFGKTGAKTGDLSASSFRRNNG